MIRKIAAVVGGAALATSLIAAGVSAQFTATASTTDTVNLGTMSVFATALDAGGTPWGTLLSSPAPALGCTITVADLQSSTGSKLCHVWVYSIGTINPSAIQITAAATSGTLSEASLWTVSDGSASGPLSGPLAWNYAAPWGSYFTTQIMLEKDFTVSWNNLTSASYGDSFVITFSVTATA
jgi:hypothetical protein